jgi:hypothetical protein
VFLFAHVGLQHQVKETAFKVHGPGPQRPDDPAPVKHADPVGHPCDLIKVVAGHQDGGAPVPACLLE